MDTIIKIEGLVKTYGSWRIDAIDLEVEAGCITGLVGKNGAGKTTTIKGLLGLINPDAGRASILGVPVLDVENLGKVDSSQVRSVKQRVGFVPDTCPFLGDVTVKQVGNTGRFAYPNWNQRRFEELLAGFGLGIDKQVKGLSRGMGMKLSLAFALAHDPDLLILDEATAGLDPEARQEVLDMLTDFVSTGSRGVLLSSHITSDLDKAADRVVCIDGGRIVFDLPKEDICDMAGVVRCRRSELVLLAAKGVQAKVLTREFGADVLVKDRFAFHRDFGEMPVDRTDIETYMSFVMKGADLSEFEGEA